MTESVKNELSDICRIIDATVDTEKIYLFGSYAYGRVASSWRIQKNLLYRRIYQYRERTRI